MTMDVTAYILAGVGGIFLAFAGLHGFENKSVTIVSFGIGAVMIVVAGCLYWQDAVWKHDDASHGSSPEVLRRQLQQKLQQTFEQRHSELIAAKAPPSEVDELYRWRDSAIKQLEQVVEFIDRAAKGRRSTIAQKAIVI